MAAEKLRNHPQLVADWDTYRAILNLMTNDLDRVRDYLIPHRSEESDPAGMANFANRQRRLYRVNHTAPYATIHWSHLSQPVSVAGADDERMLAVRADATGFGQSFEQVLRDRLYAFVQVGRVGTLVDSPAVIAPDREGAKRGREQSYEVVYGAMDVRDWTVFTGGPRKGQYSMVLLTEPSSTGKPRFRRLVQQDSENAKFSWQILEVTRKGAAVTAKEFEADVVGEGEGDLTEIPFVAFGCGPEDSLVADVWPLDVAIMNLTSVRSNIIYNQGFQRSIFAGISPEEISKMTEFTVTLIRNIDAKVFTIEAGNPQAAGEEVAALKKEADRRGKFEFNQLSDDTRQVQSADSKAKDLVTRQAIYDATLDYQQDVETRILRYHALFEGVDPDGIQVTIGREFGLDDEEAEMTRDALVFSQARELGVFELQKEILRTQADRLKFLPTETETADVVKKRVLDAIQAASPPQTSLFTTTPDLSGGVFKTLK